MEMYPPSVSLSSMLIYLSTLFFSLPSVQSALSRIAALQRPRLHCIKVTSCVVWVRCISSCCFRDVNKNDNIKVLIKMKSLIAKKNPPMFN